MKILNCTLWNNSWIPYWIKFFESHGHEVDFVIDDRSRYEDIKDKVDWADVILCHWAVGWAKTLSNVKINKPLFVIHRSFEIFEDTMVYGKVKEIDWGNVTQLFMLNESHYPAFNKKVKNVYPIFIKNGVDVDYWHQNYNDKEDSHKVGWVANINFKKSPTLALQAFYLMQQVDPNIQLHHVGQSQSLRCAMYMNNLAPYLRWFFYSYGWVKGKGKMLTFYNDKKYVLSASLVEGHPMNILEAMACGCKPLIHRYPGAEHQFPDEYIWNSFFDLQRMMEEPYEPEKYRQFIVDNYDYRKQYLPVLEAIESAA